MAWILSLCINRFLQSVTYGPTGLEYIAKDCAVQDDSTILCKTTQGVGQNLRWLVTVEGQMSTLSQTTTSYALPELLSASPLLGYTSGGILVTIQEIGRASCRERVCQSV